MNANIYLDNLKYIVLPNYAQILLSRPSFVPWFEWSFLNIHKVGHPLMDPPVVRHAYMFNLNPRSTDTPCQQRLD